MRLGWSGVVTFVVCSRGRDTETVEILQIQVKVQITHHFIHSFLVSEQCSTLEVTTTARVFVDAFCRMHYAGSLTLKSATCARCTSFGEAGYTCPRNYMRPENYAPSERFEHAQSLHTDASTCMLALSIAASGPPSSNMRRRAGRAGDTPGHLRLSQR